jgi:hypothetical protein
MRFSTNSIENVLGSPAVLLGIGELNAVVGEDRVDGTGNCGGEITQELGCRHFASFLMQFDIGQLGCPVDSNKKIELAFGGLHLGDIEMEVTDWVGFKLLFLCGLMVQKAFTFRTCCIIRKRGCEPPMPGSL